MNRSWNLYKRNRQSVNFFCWPARISKKSWSTFSMIGIAFLINLWPDKVSRTHFDRSSRRYSRVTRHLFSKARITCETTLISTLQKCASSFWLGVVSQAHPASKTNWGWVRSKGFRAFEMFRCQVWLTCHNRYPGLCSGPWNFVSNGLLLIFLCLMFQIVHGCFEPARYMPL
jgi:hypothetical protein